MTAASSPSPATVGAWRYLNSLIPRALCLPCLSTRSRSHPAAECGLVLVLGIQFRIIKSDLDCGLQLLARPGLAPPHHDMFGGASAAHHRDTRRGEPRCGTSRGGKLSSDTATPLPPASLEGHSNHTASRKLVLVMARDKKDPAAEQLLCPKCSCHASQCDGNADTTKTNTNIQSQH